MFQEFGKPSKLSKNLVQGPAFRPLFPCSGRSGRARPRSLQARSKSAIFRLKMSLLGGQFEKTGSRRPRFAAPRGMRRAMTNRRILRPAQDRRTGPAGRVRPPGGGRDRPPRPALSLRVGAATLRAREKAGQSTPAREHGVRMKERKIVAALLK
jgi:hypothetical protein